jgi:hypothetical protein
MKKILTILAILLVSQNINSQQSEFVVEHCTNNATFQSLKGLVCSNDMKRKWFAIRYSHHKAKPTIRREVCDSVLIRYIKNKPLPSKLVVKIKKQRFMVRLK